MRRHVCLGLWVLLVALAPGCDTDQPLRVDGHVVDLEFIASGAQTTQYYTWMVSENSPLQPKNGGETLWCELVKTSGNPAPGSPNSVPWTYSLQVSVIPKGETERTVITSEQAFSETFNRAEYDSSAPGHFQGGHQPFFVSHDRGACSLDQDLVCNPNSSGDHCSNQNAGDCEEVKTCSGDPDTICTGDIDCLGLGTCVLEEIQRTFVFDSSTRRLLTNANRELLNVDGNLIYDTCVGDGPCEAQVEAALGALDPPLGFCPGADLGDPGIDPATEDLSPTDPTIFGLALQKGDTLIVEARLANATPGGGQVIEFLQDPGLRARLFVDGTQLQSDAVIGTTTSPTSGPGAAIRFSFTPQ